MDDQGQVQQQQDDKGSEDKLSEAVGMLVQSTQQNNQLLQHLASQAQTYQQPEEKVEEPEQELTDEDYIRAIDEGRIGTVLKEQINKGVSKSLKEFQTQQVDPLRTGGQKVLGMMVNKVLLNDLPHYDVIKDDLNERLKQLPPDQQIDPDTINVVYKFTVADNLDKIAEAKAQAADEAELTGGGVIGPGGPGRLTQRRRDPDADPTIDELFQEGLISPAARQTIRAKGGLNAFVKKATGGRKSVKQFAQGLGWKPPTE